MDDTQLICDPEAVGGCPCDDAEYSCSCVAADHDAPRSTVCTECGSPMIRIDVDTGKRIAS